MIVIDEDGKFREVRWTAKRKARVVLDVLAGVAVDDVARTSNLDVADVVSWRDKFIRCGTDGLKSGARDSAPQR